MIVTKMQPFAKFSALCTVQGKQEKYCNSCQEPNNHWQNTIGTLPALMDTLPKVLIQGRVISSTLDSGL